MYNCQPPTVVLVRLVFFSSPLASSVSFTARMKSEQTRKIVWFSDFFHSCTTWPPPSSSDPDDDEKSKRTEFFLFHFGQANFRLFEMHVADCLLIIKFVFSFGMWCLDLSYFYFLFEDFRDALCAELGWQSSCHGTHSVTASKRYERFDVSMHVHSAALNGVFDLTPNLWTNILDFSLGSTVWFWIRRNWFWNI